MKISSALAVILALGACNVSDDDGGDPQDTSDTSDTSDTNDTSDGGGLSDAFDEFGVNVTTYADGDEVVIETNGHPDHPTPYWGPGHELYIEPTVTTLERMTPGFIERFTGSYTLRVPMSPEKASSSTATGLGGIGIAVSGSLIFNDEEGGGQPIDQALAGLDYTGAHTGPQSYHYHLETKAWSDDDDALIGIIADGFFLYGRKCDSTDDYPDDLDASGGHTSTTQHDASEHYHYHIVNEPYLGFYILFAGDYQGTPGTVR
ncbi:MAG: YHYH protein [Myxococcota bacterium]